MRILIDTKNLALYGGGIAHWFSPLLAAWIVHRPDARFLLVGPPFNTEFIHASGNWEHVHLPWPEWLPRVLRHPWYDNVLFPRAVSRLRPDLVMSPYHDVRMPRDVPSVIGVHDLCIDELASVYPRRIRAYYLALLRHNLHYADFVITVSKTSRSKLVKRYGIAQERVGVVYNTPPPDFESDVDAAAVTGFCKRHGVAGRLLFYPGGSEYRKNVGRLIQAFAVLVKSDVNQTLLVTGNSDCRWRDALTNTSGAIRERVKFTGMLSDRDLRIAYAAADAVVYPSLCEGFGRVCLEAMVAGTPLACSDLPVMREVAGEYACYFDPYDSGAIAAAIEQAMAQGRRAFENDVRFSSTTAKADFLAAMDAIMHKNDNARQGESV